MNSKLGVRLILIAVAAYVCGVVMRLGLEGLGDPEPFVFVASLGMFAGVLCAAAGLVVLLGAAWRWTRKA